MKYRLDKICFASHNADKVKEISTILDVKMLSLDEIGCTEEIEEPGKTLEANSFFKAYHVYKNYSMNCLADDSGLEVFALNSAPGVYSARYAGEHGNHEANNALLLKNMEGITDRRAKFRTVLTLIVNIHTYVFEGEVEGQIATEKRGENGFGYDSVFIPDGYDKTFAEMTLAEKNSISHRARAIEKLNEFLTLKGLS